MKRRAGEEDNKMQLRKSKEERKGNRGRVERTLDLRFEDGRKGDVSGFEEE